MRRPIFIFVVIFYIMYVTNSLFHGYLPVNPAVPAIFTTISCFVAYPQALWNKGMLCFILYVMVLLLNYSVGKIIPFGGGADTLTRIIIECAFILPSIGMASVLIYLKDIKLFKIVYITTLFSFGLTLLYILPITMSDASLFRTAAWEMINVPGTYSLYQRMGIPTYTLMHIFPVLLPVTLLQIGQSIHWWEKILYIALSLLLFKFILDLAITTTLILSLLGSYLILTYKPDSLKKNLVLMISLSLLIAWLHEIGGIAQILNYLINFFEGTAAEPKMIDFKDMYEGKDAGDTITGRQNYHWKSFKTFSEHMIIGGETIGGHSSLLDRLAGVGLLGFIPFCSMIVIQYRMWLKYLPMQVKILYYILWLTIIVLLIMKGLFGDAGWLFAFVLIPSICMYIFSHKNNLNTD